MELLKSTTEHGQTEGKIKTVCFYTGQRSHIVKHAKTKGKVKAFWFIQSYTDSFQTGVLRNMVDEGKV